MMGLICVMKGLRNHFECIQSALNTSLRCGSREQGRSHSEWIYIITVVPGV